jgi:lactoylglutathione lyase
MALLDEGETSCCYAQSDKYWITDPQGVAWEQFHTLADIPVFSHKSEPQVAAAQACCAPSAPKTVAIPIVAAPAKASSCC